MLFTFIKAQTAAVIATTLDFLVYVLLVEVFGVWYIIANVFSSLCGAICNFLLGRHWCFLASEDKIFGQGSRYILVSGMSMILNTSGVFLLTDVFSIHYLLSKAMIAVLVAVSFNFPLQRHFVFKKAIKI